VYTVHNLLDRDSREGGKPLFEELYALVDAIICHGQEAREKLKKDFGVPVEKIWVIPHGPLFVGKPTDPKGLPRKTWASRR